MIGEQRSPHAPLFPYGGERANTYALRGQVFGTPSVAPLRTLLTESAKLLDRRSGFVFCLPLRAYSIENRESSKMNEPQNIVNPDHSKTLFPQATALASFMLANDGAFLALAFVALAVPGIIQTFIPVGTTSMLVLESAKSLSGLMLLFFIARRWLPTFSGLQPTGKALGLLLAYGAGYYLLLALPLLILAANPQNPPLWALGLFVVAIVVNLRYLFFFYPIIQGKTHPTEILTGASQILLPDRWLSLKVLLVPTAITSLLSVVLLAFSVDISSQWTALGIELLGPLHYILLTYIGLSAALCSSNRASAEAALKGGRLAPKEAFAPRLLSVRSAVVYLLMSIIIWTANISRLVEDISVLDLKVSSVQAARNELTIVFEASKDLVESPFFQVQLFRLETAGGLALTSTARNASDDATSEESRHLITIDFTTLGEASDLLGREDVFLSYQGKRVMRLELPARETNSLGRENGELITPDTVPKQRRSSPSKTAFDIGNNSRGRGLLAQNA